MLLLRKWHTIINVLAIIARCLLIAVFTAISYSLVGKILVVIPSKFVVRVVATITALISLAILALALLYAGEWGRLVSGGLIVVSLPSIVFSIVAIKTGNPAWALLDLISSPW